jgi:hypothetical protein
MQIHKPSGNPHIPTICPETLATPTPCTWQWFYHLKINHLVHLGQSGSGHISTAYVEILQCCQCHTWWVTLCFFIYHLHEYKIVRLQEPDLETRSFWLWTFVKGGTMYFSASIEVNFCGIVASGSLGMFLRLHAITNYNNKSKFRVTNVRL